MFSKKFLSGFIAGTIVLTTPTISHAGFVGKTFKTVVIVGAAAFAIGVYKIFKFLKISQNTQNYLSDPSNIIGASPDDIPLIVKDLNKLLNNKDNPPELTDKMYTLIGLIDIYFPGAKWSIPIADGVKNVEPNIQQIIKEADKKSQVITLPEIQLTEDEKILEKNLLAAGFTKPAVGYKPVHIVHPTYSEFEKSREVLSNHKININDSKNGVFLPVIAGLGPEVTSTAIEENLRYSQFVTTELLRQKTKDDILKILEQNRQRLLVGNSGFF